MRCQAANRTATQIVWQTANETRVINRWATTAKTKFPLTQKDLGVVRQNRAMLASCLFYLNPDVGVDLVIGVEVLRRDPYNAQYAQGLLQLLQ